MEEIENQSDMIFLTSHFLFRIVKVLCRENKIRKIYYERIVKVNVILPSLKVHSKVNESRYTVRDIWRITKGNF